MARIEHYEFGRIVVRWPGGAARPDHPADRVVRNWWRHDGHALALEDLDQVLDDLPEHLVIGTGAHGQLRLDQRTVQRLKAGGVTVRACRPAGPSAATASWSPLGRRPPCT